jgi:hypothetical protein
MHREMKAIRARFSHRFRGGLSYAAPAALGQGALNATRIGGGASRPVSDIEA